MACGASINPDARFCHQCGVSFIEEDDLKAIEFELNVNEISIIENGKNQIETQVSKETKSHDANNTGKTQNVTHKPKDMIYEAIVSDVISRLKEKDNHPITELPVPTEFLPLNNDYEARKDKENNLLEKIKNKEQERKAREAEEDPEQVEQRKQDLQKKSRELIEKDQEPKDHSLKIKFFLFFLFLFFLFLILRSILK